MGAHRFIRFFNDPKTGEHALDTRIQTRSRYKLGNRGFNDVCILDNRKEIIFDDYHDIYLLNVKERTVGRIVHGSKFIDLSPRYLRNIWNANK